MEILEYENQGYLAQGFQQLTTFPHHAFTACAENLLLERYALLGLQHGRQLRKPNRCVAIQQIDEFFSIRCTATLFDGLDHREQRFTLAKTLYATHAQDPRALAGYCGEKHLDQRRFAYSTFPC